MDGGHGFPECVVTQPASDGKGLTCLERTRLLTNAFESSILTSDIPAARPDRRDLLLVALVCGSLHRHAGWDLAQRKVSTIWCRSGFRKLAAAGGSGRAARRCKSAAEHHGDRHAGCAPDRGVAQGAGAAAAHGAAGADLALGVLDPAGAHGHCGDKRPRPLAPLLAAPRRQACSRVPGLCGTRKRPPTGSWQRPLFPSSPPRSSPCCATRASSTSLTLTSITAPQSSWSRRASTSSG